MADIKEKLIMKRTSEQDHLVQGFADMADMRKELKKEDFEQRQVVQTDSKPNQCPDCGHSFTRKTTLRRHMAKLHNVVVPADRQQVKHKCLHAKCSQEFIHITVMLQHLKEQHGDAVDETEYEFETMNEFKQWKEMEESQNFVFFAKSGAAERGKHYFVCQRHGSQRPHRSKDEPGRKTARRNKRGSVKSNTICPARMFVRVGDSGKVSVKYIHSHNHPVTLKDTEHQPLPASVRAEIKAKLAIGIKEKDILKDLREGSDEMENRTNVLPLKRKYFVTKQQLKGMKRNKCGQKRLDNDDATSTSLKVTNLMKEPYNPILMYKPKGQSIYNINPEIDNLQGLDGMFFLAFQTKEQCLMLEMHGEKLLCIDTCHATDKDDLKLINLFVVDEFNKGYAVGHLLTTNRHEFILKYFFSAIKERTVSLRLSAIMTDDERGIFDAVNHQFGRDLTLTHFISKWPTHRCWQKRLREDLPTNINSRRMLYHQLVRLMEERSRDVFNVMATQFVQHYEGECPSFIEYISNNYLNRVQEWALCFRDLPNVTSETDTSLYVGSFLNRLQAYYMESQPNRRIDDLLDELLTLQKEDYWRHKGETKFQDQVPQQMSCHNEGLAIPDDEVVPEESAGSWKSWKITSTPGCNVCKHQEECKEEYCHTMCLDFSCIGLCQHLYSCSCQDEDKLCRHIHKVHSMLVKNYQVDNPVPVESTSIAEDVVEHEDYDVVVFQSAPPTVSASYSETQSQVDAIVSQMDVLKEHLENAKVRQLLLPHVSGTLAQLISQCVAFTNAEVVEVTEHIPQEVHQEVHQEEEVQKV